MELLPAHTHWSRYAFALSGLGIALVVAGGAAYYFSNPVKGVIWMDVSNDEVVPTVNAYSLHDLKEQDLNIVGTTTFATVVQKNYAKSATQTAGGRIAYIARSKGVQQVFIKEAGTATQVTTSETDKRDLVWAADGKSLAFSEVATTTRVQPFTIDQWSVVRLLPSGGTVTVGNGIRPFPLPGNATAVLTTRGIEEVTTTDQEPRLLIASAVPVQDLAFTVSADGMRIAWVNPADQSLQIFERTPANTYVPILLMKDFFLNSLTFSPDNNYLVAARIGELATDVVFIDIRNQAQEVVGSIPGSARVLQWHYE